MIVSTDKAAVPALHKKIVRAAAVELTDGAIDMVTGGEVYCSGCLANEKRKVPMEIKNGMPLNEDELDMVSGGASGEVGSGAKYIAPLPGMRRGLEPPR